MSFAFDNNYVDEETGDQLPWQILVNQLPSAVVVLDRKGLIFFANELAESLLSDFPYSLSGSRWIEVIAHVFGSNCADGHDVALKSGRLLSVETQPLSDVGQLVLFHDVSDTRYLQQELSHHERLSSMGQMVASLAHQIRTPLSTAMLYSANLSTKQLSGDQYRRFSQRIHSQLQTLEQQITDMLVFSRGEVVLDTEINCDDLMLIFQQRVSELANAQQVKFTFLNRVAANGQLKLSLQTFVGAILNLVNNAVEACGSNAEIDVFIEDQSNQRVDICVRDNGPGMNEEQLEKATEAFFTTKSQGTGLGLAVVNAVAEAHGGSFRISSVPGKGCLCIVSLPIGESV